MTVVEADGELCIPNIDARGRRGRQRFGIIAIGIGLALGVGLALADLSPAWRLTAFLPLAAGASGIFQARAKT